MRLYYKAGACSQAVNIVLQELGVRCDLDAVDRATGMTESGVDFRTKSPHGYVPALELDDGTVLLEGVAINQYLADRNPASGLAPRPATLERAEFNALLNWLASELHKSFSPFFKLKLEGSNRAAALDVLSSRMDRLERRLSDGRAYLTGHAFTIADAYAFVITGWADRLGFGLARWPHVAAYRERVAQRDSVRAALRAEGLLEQGAAGA